MKNYLLILIFSGFSIYAQESGGGVSFEKMIQRFKKDRFNDNDSITKSSLFRNEDFTISISSNPIHFNLDSLILKNPYYTDDYSFNGGFINYPVSYSVIFGGRLISLFGNGKFVCHDLNNFLRDEEFEQRLNTKKFKYQWVIEGKLYGHSKGRLFNGLYEWNNSKWIKSKISLPVDERPILYNDREFIVFGDCHGEWGGTVYFYDKATNDVYFTESTCANSVIKKEGKYIVLAHLGHMSGSSEIKSIPDPRQLSKVDKKDIGKPTRGGALGYMDKTGAYEKLLDFYDIQLFSTFDYEEKQLFIANLNLNAFYNPTFITELKGNKLEIVHPLFNNDKYTHDPVTRSYGKYTLINLDHYGTARDREVSIIIIKDGTITLIDWNEDHNPVEPKYEFE